MQISSIGRHHPRLREVRRAIRAGTLTPDGRLPIEGPHLVDEAIGSGLEISEAFIREDLPERHDIPHLYRVGLSVFGDLAATRHSQGIIALVRLPAHRLDEVISSAGRIAVLCGLQDPGNVGTILRLADAFGCSGCISVAPTVSFYNDKVVRASAGSLFRVPHVRVPDFETIRHRFTSASIAIVGTAADAGSAIRDQNWSRPTAILFGNEGGGLDASLRRACDAVVSIACPGPVQSLNAATAAAIVLYEAARGS